ncbi:BAG family molecular chaperone regulator 4 isoform X2 [Accipiter gentilis]|uniref:BAG family molecular chaperone regulator 4 isoform X2 n=1 Tax=Astur gentilis TaxID=8957 RepID=UPI0021104C31|nr:BAG family molecular chaperone regulator 4 isoform X2 [Accipiter gentilis]
MYSGHGFSLCKRSLQPPVSSGSRRCPALHRPAADTGVLLLHAFSDPLPCGVHRHVPALVAGSPLELRPAGLSRRRVLAQEAACSWLLPTADPRNAHPAVSIRRQQSRGHGAGASTTAQTPRGHVGSPHRLWGAATLRVAGCFGAREPLRLRIASTLDWQRSFFPPFRVGLKGSEHPVAQAVSSRHVPLAGDLLFNSQGLERGFRVPLWDFSQKPGRGDMMCYDITDTAYNKPEQSANQHNYYSDVNHQHSGTMNDHKPATPLNAKPSPSNAKVQYSAQPQMYDTASRKLLAGNREAGFKPGDQPSTNSAAIQPEIQRILHVMGEAEQLGQEVDEFVGKKTDKSYRLLEEMLTKLLLELDSIETGGQDSVRQARKESVHRIQAILEKLERKGL